MLYPLPVKKTKILHIYSKKQPYPSEFLVKTSSPIFINVNTESKSFHAIRDMSSIHTA
jgi:hypothetical protein